MKVKIKATFTSWLLIWTWSIPPVALAEVQQAVDVVENACQAVYSATDQALTIPCVAMIAEGKSMFYSAQLQQVVGNDSQFLLADVAERQNGDEDENACWANYSLETGELVVPCVNGENQMVVLYATELATPLLFMVNDETRTTLERNVRAASSPPEIYAIYFERGRLFDRIWVATNATTVSFYVVGQDWWGWGKCKRYVYSPGNTNPAKINEETKVSLTTSAAVEGKGEVVFSAQDAKTASYKIVKAFYVDVGRLKLTNLHYNIVVKTGPGKNGVAYGWQPDSGGGCTYDVPLK